MTEEECEKIIAAQNAVINVMKARIIKAKNVQREAVNDFCQSLNERYVDFLGKKVEVEFTPTYCGKKSKKVVVGYLSGFKKGQYSRDIRPVLLKINKGGTASKMVYSEYDVCNYKYISNIKIVE